MKPSEQVRVCVACLGQWPPCPANWHTHTHTHTHLRAFSPPPPPPPISVSFPPLCLSILPSLYRSLNLSTTVLSPSPSLSRRRPPHPTPTPSPPLRLSCDLHWIKFWQHHQRILRPKQAQSSTHQVIGDCHRVMCQPVCRVGASGPE